METKEALKTAACCAALLAAACGTPTNTDLYRQAGHDFLVSGRSERPGFGLYSYVLFGSPPDDTQRPAYLATLRAVFQTTPDIDAVLISRAPSDLNVVYAAVRNEPPPNSASMAAEALSEWTLQNYDYGRAGLLLSKLAEEPAVGGPYIVATRPPLSTLSGNSPHLYWDLSVVPAKVIPAYITEFKRQSARNNFWQEDKMAQWILTLRSNLELVGESVPEIKGQLKALQLFWKPAS